MDRKNRLKEAYKYLQSIGKCLAHAWSKNTVTARYISDDRRKVDQAFALVLEKVKG